MNVLPVAPRFQYLPISIPSVGRGGAAGVSGGHALSRMQTGMNHDLRGNCVHVCSFATAERYELRVTQKWCACTLCHDCIHVGLTQR